MDQSIKYTLLNEDFDLLGLEDGAKKHHEPGDMVQWGLEVTLKRDLSGYYFFSTHLYNQEKGLIIDQALVNGVKAERCEGLGRGEFLIAKSRVRPPLRIEFVGVKALRIHFRNLTHSDALGLPGDNVDVSIFDYRFSSFSEGGSKPKFTAYRAGTEEEIALEGFSYFASAMTPSISFVMPPFDVDIDVGKVKDEDIAPLTVDPSGLDSHGFEGVSTLEGIVSEALYSDDYDAGIVDHEFGERRILFRKGARLKVELYLKERVDLSCSLNGVVYAPCSVEAKEVRVDEERLTTAYFYVFKPLVFLEEGTLSFRVGS